MQLPHGASNWYFARVAATPNTAAHTPPNLAASAVLVPCSTCTAILATSTRAPSVSIHGQPLLILHHPISTARLFFSLSVCVLAFNSSACYLLLLPGSPSDPPTSSSFFLILQSFDRTASRLTGSCISPLIFSSRRTSPFAPIVEKKKSQTSIGTIHTDILVQHPLLRLRSSQAQRISTPSSFDTSGIFDNQLALLSSFLSHYTRSKAEVPHDDRLLVLRILPD